MSGQAGFTLRGRVVDEESGAGLPGLRVVALDAERGQASMLLVAETGSDGTFVLEIDRESAGAFLRFPPECDLWTATKTLQLSVFNGRVRLGTFEQRIGLEHLTRGELPEDLEVRVEDTARTARLRFEVTGVVLDADGVPQTGVTVRAYRVELGSTTTLGVASTDAAGAYTIAYDGHDGSRPDAPAIDLQVVASLGATEVGRSPVVFSAKPQQRIDLVVGTETYRGRSEVERVSMALAPHLGGTSLEALGPEAVELLAARADIYPPNLAMHIQAGRLSAAHDVDAPIFYALMRGGLPPDLPGMLSQSRAARRSALSAAYAERIMPTPTSGTVEEAIDAALADLDALVVDAALVEPQGGETNLRALLDTSGLSESLLRDFLELQVPFEGSNKDLWEAVHAHPNLTGAPAEALAFTMEASVLVRSFLPALEGLQALRTAETIETVADLADWDVPEWLTFIGGNGGAPDDLPGETAGEREQLYAATMTRIVEERYPTQVLARRIQRDTPTSTTGVTEFLDDNPEFNVVRSVIPIYLDENPPSPPLTQQVEANLKAVQRVWSLTPRFDRYNVARVLLDGGITSAAQIVHGGPKAFTTAFATSLDGVHPLYDGETLSAILYKTAVVKHTSAQMVLTQYSRATNPIQMHVMEMPPKLPVMGSGVPTLTELMGNLDFCACEHCRSMLSPAAYFVDLLSRLGQTNALGELEARRGDLRFIELSCVNTNTVLPYIDIVNELLEYLATNEGSPADMPAHQTTWTAAELREFPEHRDPAAYNACADEVYPWSLPMHLSSVELGLYLQRLGVGRHEMMRAVQKPGGTEPAAAAIVAEALGLTLFEQDVVIGAPPVTQAEPWNLSGADFSDTLRTDLRTLLDIVELELDALVRLLVLRFIVRSDDQPTQWLVYPGGQPSCDLDEIDLDVAFDDNVADRLHRFMRLSRKTGLSWPELDSALRLRGEERSQEDGVLDQQFLAELVDLLWLRSRLGLELVSVLAMSSRIETHDYEGAPSLYSRLFLSKADPDDAFELTGDDLTPPQQALSAVHHDTIRAGIRVNAADLELLIAQVLPPTPNLNRTTLSTLYAHATLARALGLRIDELLRLRALVDADPFASPAETVVFVEVADEIAASRMSIAQLDYLFRHRFDEASGLHPLEEDIDAVLQKIADGLAALEAELAAVAQQHPELREQLLAHLEAVFTERQPIVDWMRILDQEDPPSPMGEDLDDLKTHVEAIGMNSDFVDDLLSPWPNYDPAILAFETYRREKGQNALIDETLAAATGLTPEAVGILARTAALIALPGSPPLSVQEVLVDAVAPEADKVEVYLRVHKAALIILGLEIPASDLHWYFDFDTDVDTPQALDLNALPLLSQDDGTEHMERWRRVALGQALQESFTSAHNPLPEIGADDVPRQDVVDLFVANSTWEQADVEFLLVGTGFLDLPDPVDPPLRDPRLVARIRDMMELVRRTGVRAEIMAGWARQSVPTASTAAAARRALKARHAESAWTDVVVPLTDGLRERQRDALVALIVQNEAWFEDDIALFSALLVDPKMNACMLTSRIRLALSSVQLFIQRLLLDMEDGEIPHHLPEDWVWMRAYRVWEANRKVFFWPENWAEPELRDDKTPFFRELEEQLEQGPLDELAVERAYADYLYKLHEVGHLDIVALYHEVLENNEGDRAHVLGRTRSLPRKHFYRKRVNNKEWTAWERPPLEIDSDQVVLVGHNRRLFMIWLHLREEAEQHEEDDTKGRPPTFYRFQLSWSERRDGEDWLPARTTEISKASTEGEVAESRNIYLRTSIDDEGHLSVNVLFGKPVGPHDVLVWYSYDDCLDTMNEEASSGGAYPRDLVGLHHSRVVFAQQQRSIGPIFWLLDLVDGSYSPNPLMTVSGVHRVMLSHPPKGNYVGQDTPVTFDNGEHAFYITRANVERRDPYGSGLPGLPEPAAPAPEVPLPLAQPLPPFDVISSVSPWAGTTPGVSTMNFIAYAPVGNSDTTVVLALSQQLAQASIELGLKGGGINVPVMIEDEEELERGYFLETFYHPYTCLMRSELNRHGVDGLLAPQNDQLKRQYDFENHEFLSFTWLVAEPYPLDDFDFHPAAAYGVYNWELFYHAPLYIAERLRREQRFEQAMRWYHFIFDPLGRTALPGDDGTERYWNVKPLYQEAKGDLPSIDIIKYVFDQGLEGFDENDPAVSGFLASVEAWIDDPFSPHAIARWRPGTYRWVVLQRYLDNVIEWADSLFRRDTIETINEATQLYLLAAQILGARPRPLPAITPPVSTYDELDTPEIFGGFAELEDFMPTPTPSGGDPEEDLVWQAPAPPGPMWWYFCVPPNEKLLAYWDTVADRLFKIRNCQNIDGVRRALALFDPPIDPALLVKAKAAGLDLGAVIADLQSPLPHHRYRVLAARALELCGDVRTMGSALQQALERKDAEHLQELRATHEVALLQAIRRVREAQIEEAEENRKVLDEQMKAAIVRHQYYATRERHSAKEQSSALMFKAATGVMIGASAIKLLGGILHMAVPQTEAGTGFFLGTGGPPIGGGFGIIGDGLELIASRLRDESSMLQVEAGYERRWEEWKFQEGQALLEQDQIVQQQVAADIRTTIAKRELENHDRQIEQSKGAEEFLRTRYTNEQLYNWLIGQISTLYFQSYKLAYDMAKKAERAMRYELGNDDTYVEFGHWDSLHKGLLAGERLQLDLRRMEIAYLDKRRREYELTKRISLRLLDASALLDLQATGTCEFAVPEVVFDLDHPGHYMRRIKAVSLTIPAVTGPHVTLGAKLTLLQDIVRINAELVNDEYRIPEETPIYDDERFRLGYGGVGSIATSTAQADSGLFNLDFNDDRLLPFEGAGAISRWRLELPSAVRQFDYDTITDVELQIQYTARDGGQALRGQVEEELQQAVEDVLVASSGFTLVLSAKEAFPEAWEKFLYPVESPQDPLEIPIVLDQLSYVMRQLEANVYSVHLVFVPRDGVTTSPIGVPGTVTLTAPGGGPESVTIAEVDGRYQGVFDDPAGITITTEPWLLALDTLTIDEPDDLDNLYVVVRLMFDDSPQG